jgi:hypothetical protein
MQLLYSRHVSALILGHHQVNLQNIKKEALFIQRIFVDCCETEGIIYS